MPIFLLPFYFLEYLREEYRDQSNDDEEDDLAQSREEYSSNTEY